MCSDVCGLTTKSGAAYVEGKESGVRQEIWNLLEEVPTESSCRIRRCLRQIQFQSMHFRLESNSFLFSCQRLSLEILHVFFNASCQSKSRSIISRFHWGFCELCVFQIKWMRTSFMVCSTWESVCFNTQTRVAKDFSPREQPLTSYVNEAGGETGKLE